MKDINNGYQGNQKITFKDENLKFKKKKGHVNERKIFINSRRGNKGKF